MNVGDIVTFWSLPDCPLVVIMPAYDSPDGARYVGVKYPNGAEEPLLESSLRMRTTSSSIVDCTPTRADWRRKQMKYREYAQPPRQFAVYVWCAVPPELDDWSKHWTGRKGTGPYRNTHKCVGALVPACVVGSIT